MIKDNKAAASPSDNSNSVRKKTPVVAAVNLEEELSRSLREERIDDTMFSGFELEIAY